jgi:hypothetical protein
VLHRTDVFRKLAFSKLDSDINWVHSACHVFLEGVSKPQMAFEGKAKADEKAQHTREYVSILKRLSTQPSGVRWGFEMASNTSSNRC